MKIALTTDHAGFQDIKDLASFLENLGHEVIYYGPRDLEPDDDYPDYMFPAAIAVSRGECQVGIILGGSGQGEAMAANRVKNVRAAVYYGPAIAKSAVDSEGHIEYDPHEVLKLSRTHNLANVLSLAARFLSLKDIKEAINIWLDTPMGDEPRHIRRIQKLDNIKTEDA